MYPAVWGVLLYILFLIIQTSADSHEHKLISSCICAFPCTWLNSFRPGFVVDSFRKDLLLFLPGVWGNYQLRDPLTEFSVGKFCVTAQVVEIPAPKLQESCERWLGLQKTLFSSLPRAKAMISIYYIFSISFRRAHVFFSSLTEEVTFIQSYLCAEAITMNSYVVGILGPYLRPRNTFLSTLIELGYNISICYGYYQSDQIKWYCNNKSTLNVLHVISCSRYLYWAC